MELETIRMMLAPTPEQERALEATFEAFEGACRYAMKVGRATGATGNAVLYRLCYRRLREVYGLSARLTVRAIARAARVLKMGDQAANAPPGEASIEYDARTFSLDLDAGCLSIVTTHGRLRNVAVRIGHGTLTLWDPGRPTGALLVRVQPGRYWMAVVFGGRFARRA